MQPKKADLSYFYSTQTDVNLTLKKIDKRQNKLKADVLTNHYGLFLKKRLIQSKLEAGNRPKSMSFAREEAARKNVSQFIIEDYRAQVKEKYDSSKNAAALSPHKTSMDRSKMMDSSTFLFEEQVFSPSKKQYY